MNTYSSERQERYFFYNSLAILLKAVEGKCTTVDLRNEASIYGMIEQADGFMNIVMKDCVFTDPRGDQFEYEIFFVHARNIRYVHIPTQIRIVPSIREQLKKLNQPHTAQVPKRTFKSKRVEKIQAEGLESVRKILEDKEDKSKPGGSDSKE